MQTKTTFHTHQSISVTGPKIDLHALYWYAHTYACVCVCVCMCLIEWCEGRTCLSRGARMYVCILRNYDSSWGCTQAYFPPVAHKQFWNVCIHTYTFMWMRVCVLSPRNFEDCLLRFAHTLTYVFTSQQCLHMHKMLFWRKNIM